MRSRRVLVVTATPETGPWIADVLTLEGDVADAVTDAAQAFQRVWESEYDAIIAELGMPGVDGRDLFMALQNTWPEMARRMIFVATAPTATQERFVAHTGALLLRGAPSVVDVRGALQAVCGLPRATAIA